MTTKELDIDGRVRVGLRLSRQTLRTLRHIAADQDCSTSELIEKVLGDFTRDYDRDVREIPTQRPNWQVDDSEADAIPDQFNSEVSR